MISQFALPASLLNLRCCNCGLRQINAFKRCSLEKLDISGNYQIELIGFKNIKILLAANCGFNISELEISGFDEIFTSDSSDLWFM